jgi:hypothetical protein
LKLTQGHLAADPAECLIIPHNEKPLPEKILKRTG